MGLLSKIGQKIGNAMEKSASQNMTGESKELYEKEKAEREQRKMDQVIDPMIDISFTKDELKDLDLLIRRADMTDDRGLWIAGFSNHRHNQNASAANLFSGKKNLRFLTLKGDLLYFAHFVDDHFKTYKALRKENIRKMDIKMKLIGASTCYIELKDQTIFTIDITENKQKASEIKEILK